MNVFLIESPLQLLNAIEAQSYYKIKKEDTWLLLQNGEIPETLEQMKNMIEPELWPNVRVVGSGKGKISWFTRMLGLKKLAKKSQSINRLFIGDYRSDLMRDFAATVDYNQLIIIDDGAATLNTYKSLVDEKSRNEFLKDSSKADKTKSMVKKVAYSGHAPKKEHPEHIQLFTVYDLPSTDEIEVHKNDYHFHKTISKEKKVEDKICLLGTPLPEKNVISGNQKYLEYLKTIKENLPNLPLVYIPHRAEDGSKLQEIEELGFNIDRNNTCVEHKLIYSDTIPKYIVSFYSSALINLKQMMNSDVKIISYKIPTKDITASKASSIQSVYEYYAKEVNVYDIEPSQEP
ncbi:hypothetical protein [Rossellomorea sp. NS-SX7]|uniref:hypothetical protein n=1 Tax=Rossellomorea sp. NS-SX7 TaxID=3463856 RepID=UPI00405913D0